MTSTRIPALRTSPAENTRCADCESLAFEERVIHGVRYEGCEGHFAHCPECGTTDLYDDRSPWTILAEAIRNAEEADLDPLTRMTRLDVVEVTRRLAEAADPCECGECREAKRLVV